jgi:hypothetical protein
VGTCGLGGTGIIVTGRIRIGATLLAVVFAAAATARPADASVPVPAAWGVPNGCGSGGWINTILGSNPYNAQFTPACDLHDWCYGGAAKPRATGDIGDWLLRLRCDNLFHQRMLATCGTDTNCQNWADDYYSAVRTFGDSSLFGKPYTSGQRDGQHNLLPNPRWSNCTGCVAGNSSITVHINVRGSNTTYWKLDNGGWHKISCPAWDPNHVACAADVSLNVSSGPHAFRVKAVDYYTGDIGRTTLVTSWTT